LALLTPLALFGLIKRGSLNVRFAPKATELLRRREMSRRVDIVEKVFCPDVFILFGDFLAAVLAAISTRALLKLP